MELSKYKICPECGKHNSPSLFECSFCEADLTGIKVVDQTSQTEDDKLETENEITTEETVVVRVCECGAENASQARKCRVCGEDISDIIPSCVSKEKQNISYTLDSFDGEFSMVIDKPVMVVGREADLKEYLGNKMYVSRKHAKFTVAADKVFVENISNTNKTFLNNEAIPESTPTPLNSGDEIGLGGKVINGSRQDNAAYFIFKV